MDDDDKCTQSLSGLHDMRFLKREVIGTVPFITYKCRHCGEEINIEVNPWGNDGEAPQEV